MKITEEGGGVSCFSYRSNNNALYLVCSYLKTNTCRKYCIGGEGDQISVRGEQLHLLPVCDRRPAITSHTPVCKVRHFYFISVYFYDLGVKFVPQTLHQRTSLYYILVQFDLHYSKKYSYHAHSMRKSLNSLEHNCNI